MIKTCRCGKDYEAGEGFYLVPVCPDCEIAWDAEIDAREKVTIETIDEHERIEKLGIRPRHFDCTFDSFKSTGKDSDFALASCRKMAESRRGIIALIGNNGTGKTHLACATVRAIGSGKIMKMIEIGMFIRKAFGSNSHVCEQDQLDDLVKLPFLAIDEAEKSKRTDNEMNWLSYIIDERNERYRPTILIANLHPAATHADGSRCDKCFEAILTPDVLDRISQTGIIRYFSGESYRRNLRGM